MKIAKFMYSPAMLLSKKDDDDDDYSERIVKPIRDGCRVEKRVKP